jgi:putative transcription antitermination factor YqgF
MPRIIAFDYGTKRIGLAVTDPMQIIATGLDTVHPKDIVQYLKNYLLNEQVEAFVFGDPKQMDGSPSDTAQHVKGFARTLKITAENMSLIDDDMQQLLLQYCEPESELLQRIDRQTNLKVLMPRMLSGHYQGRVLSMLSKMISPTRILEVGTFTGYATLCLAEGLRPDGLIYTLDINEELEDMVRESFLESGLDSQIRYIIGDATKTLRDIDEVFDLVFIDADKKNNGTYYDMVFDRVRPGGLIIVDNVLWSGKVLQDKQDKDTKNITTFNDKIAADGRVEKLILPVRDGLFIIRKK